MYTKGISTLSNKWDIRFLELAKGIAGWSKDPSRKIGAAEKVVGGAVGKVAGFVSGGVSKIGGLFGGGGDDDGGGGGVEDTTSGFGGGAGTVNQTFNITMEVSGITDRTDKRSLAEEVAAMIQDELSRNSNTTSYNISGR